MNVTIPIKRKQSILSGLITWNYLPLVLIVIVILGVHFFSINQPQTPVFDEKYYISDAKSIIDHQTSMRPEHPPLGKLFIAAGIHLFGDNPFGWRFFSAIFGVLSIVLFFLICRKLGLSWRTSNIATFLFGFENLSFIQANIAMLDVFSLTFMLAAMLFYLRQNYLLAGFLGGLGILSKLPGILVLGIIFIYWLIVEREKWKGMLFTILLALATFFILMPVLEYSITSQWYNPIERINQMLNAAKVLNLDFGTGSNVSQPWDWLMNQGILFYNYQPQYIGMINPTIIIMVIPCLAYWLCKMFKQEKAVILALAWFICAYGSWILISLIFERMMYIYYFYPVVGAICIGTGLILSRFRESSQTESRWHINTIGKWMVAGYLALHLAIFVIISPLMPSIVSWVNL